MSTKQHIELHPDERAHLEEIVRTGRAHTRTINHAHILLLSDESETGPGWSDDHIAEALTCSPRTVARLRSRFNGEGLEAALRVRKPGGGRPPKIEGATEAHLMALACSEPPSGRTRWTIRLLADRFVDLCQEKGLEPLSREAVRLTLKKMNLNPIARNSG